MPDVLNGQAWNAYAYVYNDPINLVDPSGYAPWDGPVNRIREAAGNAWRSVKDGFGRANQWWNEKPDPCDCEEEGSNLGAFWDYTSGMFHTAYLGSPLFRSVKRIGTLSASTRRMLGPLPVSSWETNFSETRPLKEMKGYQQYGNRWKYRFPAHNGRTQVEIRFQTGWRNIKPVAGLVGAATLADMLLQALTDGINNLCLSPRDRFMRTLVTGVLGLGIGVLGAGITSMLGGTIAASAVGIGTVIGINSALTRSGTRNHILEWVTS